jgi:hypothetical protein
LEFRAYPQVRTLQVPIGKFREFNTILLLLVMCFIVFIIDKKNFSGANVRLILPPALREDEEIKFPLVIKM